MQAQASSLDFLAIPPLPRYRSGLIEYGFARNVWARPTHHTTTAMICCSTSPSIVWGLDCSISSASSHPNGTQKEDRVRGRGRLLRQDPPPAEDSGSGEIFSSLFVGCSCAAAAMVCCCLPSSSSLFGGGGGGGRAPPAEDSDNSHAAVALICCCIPASSSSLFAGGDGGGLPAENSMIPGRSPVEEEECLLSKPKEHCISEVVFWEVEGPR